MSSALTIMATVCITLHVNISTFKTELTIFMLALKNIGFNIGIFAKLLILLVLDIFVRQYNVHRVVFWALNTIFAEVFKVEAISVKLR